MWPVELMVSSLQVPAEVFLVRSNHRSLSTAIGQRSGFQRRFRVAPGSLSFTRCHLQGSKQERPAFDFQSKVEDMGKRPHSVVIVCNAAVLVRCEITKLPLDRPFQ